MSLRSILKEIRRSFTFWMPIEDPPRWVRKAYDRWEEKLLTHAYGMVKHFVGKNYIYKVYCETVGQGQVELHWYRKKRIR